jgi:hypothetical protein
MIYFLRTEKNKTILDLEVFVKDSDTDFKHSFVELHSAIDIENYSRFLLKNFDRQDEIISDFDMLSELRGWLWEKYFMGRQNNGNEYTLVIKELKPMLKNIAEKYNLALVED